MSPTRLPILPRLPVLPVLVLLAGLAGCELDCASIRQEFASQVENIRRTRAACQTVDDCTTAEVTNDCAGFCPVAVAKGQAAAFRSDVRVVASELCGSSFGASCGMVSPSCAAPQLSCTAGRCENTFP